MIGRVDGGDSQQSFLTGADPNGAEANGSAPTGGAIDGARTDAAPTDAAPKVGTPTGRAPGGEGWTTSADPGTAAVLHGMMTMLSEVLEGLDRRLHALEEAVGDRLPQPAAAAPLSSADLAAELAPVTERLADLEQSLTALRDRPDPTSELVGELRQRLHRRDGEAALHAAVEGLAATVVRVEARLAALAEGDRVTGVDRLVERVDLLEGSMRTAIADGFRGVSAAAADVGEQVRRADPVDDDLYAAVVSVGERLAHTDDLIGAAVADLRSLVADSLGGRGTESINAAVAELSAISSAADAGVRAALADFERRLVDAAQAANAAGADAAGAAATGQQVIAAVSELKERVRLPRPIDEVLASAIQGVDERVAGLAGRVDGMAATVEGAGEAPAERVLASIADLKDRVRKPRPVDEEIKLAMTGAVERVAGLEAELAGATRQVAQDVRAGLGRLHELAAATTALQAESAATAAGVSRIAEDGGGRSQALLDAIAASGQESHERMRSLHASLVRHLDGAGGAGQADGVVAEVQHRLDEVLAAVKSVRASVDRLPPGLEGGLARIAADAAEQQGALTVSLDSLRKALEDQSDGMRKVQESLHALGGMVDGSLERMRSSVGEGLVGVGRRSASAVKLSERLVTMVEDERRGIEAIHALCQSLAGAVEHSGALTGRVADIVLESRSAMRGDAERVETAVHLETIKQYQQNQAQLAQAVAAIGDVVERESAVLSQRLSAVTATVETIRTVLHTHVEGGAGTGRAPEGRPRDDRLREARPQRTRP